MSETPEVVESESLSDEFAAIEEASNAGDEARVQELMDELTNSEIARLLESVPPNRRSALWSHVGSDREGEVLVYVNDEVRTTLIRDMDDAALVAATNSLELDDLADILGDLPDGVTRELLLSMDKEHRERLTRVLSYPENSAGGLMNPDVVTVRADVSLETVLRYLRFLGDLPDLVDDLFVVDRDGRYAGRLQLSDVLTRAPTTLVEELVDRSLPALDVNMPATQVAREFEHHDLVTAPVIDTNEFLVGRITVDDVVDVIRDEADHSVLSMAGLDEEEDMFAPVLKSSRRRIVWLGFNLITAFLAAAVISLFEATIQEVVALAVLMPIVASMGGIAATQTLSLMIRGMATGQVGAGNTRALLRKEFGVGALNGAAFALVVSAMVWIWFGDSAISTVFAAAMLINLTIAALAGVIVPLALARMNIDPALAGGMVVTTVTDVVGFFVFLGSASVILV